MDKAELQAKIFSITERVLKECGITRAIDRNIPLNENGLGLDSISRLTLLSELESELNVEFSEEYWGSKTFQSISDIENYIIEKCI